MHSRRLLLESGVKVVGVGEECLVSCCGVLPCSLLYSTFYLPIVGGLPTST